MKLFLIVISFLYSQTWEPFHGFDQKFHKYKSINYSQIDSINNDNSPQLRQNLSHKVIGYLPYWMYDTYNEIDYSLLTEINYFSAELNEYGNIINDHNWDNINFINYAQQRGVKVKLCATLFDSNQLEILLSSSLNRTNAIYNLLNKVLDQNADGIDIDFELVPSTQRENLVIFMQELSDVFHSNISDPVITMATPAIDWSNSWDYNALAQICDGLFIMGYNYFYSGSSTAGPISPLGGYFYDLDYTVNDYIQKTNYQLDKLILGLPYYGYDWPVTSSIIHSTTTSSGEALTYNNVESILNQNFSNWNTISNAVWFPYNNSDNWNQVWYDDSLSLSIKYNFAKQVNLAGVGIWALGYDNNSTKMWGSIRDQFADGLFGDLNYDLEINILDISLLILNITSNDMYIVNFDLNQDTIINIQDIILLVNLILDS